MASSESIDEIKAQRRGAWKRLERDTSEAISRLLELGPGLPTTLEAGERQSNFWRVLQLAAKHLDHSTSDLSVPESALDLLDVMLGRPLRMSAQDQPSLMWTLRAAVTSSTRTYLVAQLRNPAERRRLPYPPALATDVLRELVSLSTEIVDGKLAFDTARDLAMDYTPHLPVDHPLVRIWDRSSTSDEFTSFTTLEKSVELDRTHPQSQLQSRTTAEQGAPIVPGILSAQDLISMIAPALLKQLQSAPEPPLGIAPTRTQTTGQAQTDASAYAGKVYTSHEFRNRETSMPSGLGAGAAGGTATAAVTGMGVTSGEGVISGGVRLGGGPHIDTRAYGSRGVALPVAGSTGYATMNSAAMGYGAEPGGYDAYGGGYGGYGAGAGGSGGYGEYAAYGGHGAYGGAAYGQHGGMYGSDELSGGVYSGVGVAGVTGAALAYPGGIYPATGFAPPSLYVQAGNAARDHQGATAQLSATPTGTGAGTGASRSASRHVDEWSR